MRKEKNAMKISRAYPNGGDELKKLLKQVKVDEERERQAEEEIQMATSGVDDDKENGSSDLTSSIMTSSSQRDGTNN